MTHGPEQWFEDTPSEPPGKEPASTPESARAQPANLEVSRAEADAALALRETEMARRVQTEQDTDLANVAADELLLAAVERARLDPAIDQALGIRESKLRLEQKPGEPPLGIEDVIRERMAQTITVRIDGLRHGQATADEFRAGIAKQVRNIIDEFRKADAPKGGQPKRRPIDYGRPPASPPMAA